MFQRHRTPGIICFGRKTRLQSPINLPQPWTFFFLFWIMYLHISRIDIMVYVLSWIQLVAKYILHIQMKKLMAKWSCERSPVKNSEEIHQLNTWIKVWPISSVLWNIFWHYCNIIILRQMRQMRLCSYIPYLSDQVKSAPLATRWKNLTNIITRWNFKKFVNPNKNWVYFLSHFILYRSD